MGCGFGDQYSLHALKLLVVVPVGIGALITRLRDTDTPPMVQRQTLDVETTTTVDYYGEKGRYGLQINGNGIDAHGWELRITCTGQARSVPART